MKRGAGNGRCFVSDAEAKEILGEGMFSLLQKMDQEYFGGSDYKQSRNEIVVKNLGLARKIARHYERYIKGDSAITVDDLVQEGVFGLMRAAEKFNKSLGYKFSTYAVWWVKAFIARYLNRRGTIRIPSEVGEKISVLCKKTDKQVKELLYGPMDKSSVVRTMGWTEETLDRVLDGIRSQQTVSLESLLHSPRMKSEKKYSDGLTWEEYITDKYGGESQQSLKEKDCKKIEMRILAASSLSEKAIYSYWMHVWGEESLENIGGFLHLTKERIRQLEFKAKEKLKKKLFVNLIAEFLSGQADLWHILVLMPKPQPEKKEFLEQLDRKIEEKREGARRRREQKRKIMSLATQNV